MNLELHPRWKDCKLIAIDFSTAVPFVKMERDGVALIVTLGLAFTPPAEAVLLRMAGRHLRAAPTLEEQLQASVDATRGKGA